MERKLNTSERLLKKFLDAILINRKTIGEESLKSTLTALKLLIPVIEEELERKRNIAKPTIP
jgi:hypothetical protein